MSPTMPSRVRVDRPNVDPGSQRKLNSQHSSGLTVSTTPLGLGRSLGLGTASPGEPVQADWGTSVVLVDPDGNQFLISSK
jgi:hypothetical protein